VPELALDHDDRDAFASHLHGVSVAELVRRERRLIWLLRPRVRRSWKRTGVLGPWPALVGAVG